LTFTLIRLLTVRLMLTVKPGGSGYVTGRDQPYDFLNGTIQDLCASGDHALH
jgi:hypothetical protein